MNTLEQPRIRLREHLARCQICNRRIKLRGPIPSSLRPVTAQTVFLVQLLPSRKIPFGLREPRDGNRQPADDHEPGDDMQVCASHLFLFPVQLSRSAGSPTAFVSPSKTSPKPPACLVT